MPFRTRSTQTPPHPPRTAITRRIRSFNQPSALMVEALESRVLMSVTPAGAAQASRGKVKGRGIVRVPVEINSKTMVSNIVAMTAEEVPPVVTPTVDAATIQLPALAPAAPVDSAVSDAVDAISSSLAPAQPTAATVVGRYLFYTGTPWYGETYAWDKSALLPGQASSFANVTTYAGGINEVVVDVANGGTYSAADFSFKVGNSSDPSSWANGAAPVFVGNYPGSGVSGSNRVVIKWADGSIVNQWLQIKFNPSGDSFYFGSLVGSTGGLQVTSTDEAFVRANPNSLLSPASINNNYDFNRDGKVDAIDQLVARSGLGHSLAAFTAPTQTVTSAAYDWHTQMINGVLNVWAPNPYDFGATYAVTDSSALFGADGVPQLTSLHQGPTADCYFLAAEGSLAFNNPSKITSIVSNDNSGGWAVTFQYWDTLSLSMRPIVFHTSKELSAGLQFPQGEVWTAVMEKAYAAFRTWNGLTSTNTMASLNWGYGGTAFTALSETYSGPYYIGMPQSWDYSTLQNALNARQPILFHTSAAAPSMIASHVYIITGVSTDASGTMWVQTYNPWGFYDTRSMSDLLQNGTGSFVIGAA